MTNVKVLEVTKKTNKNGEPYWDIKVEDGARLYSVRDRIPRVDWQSSCWYEVSLGERQPISGQPGKYYLAEVLLAEPIEAPPESAQPHPATTSGRYTIEEIEEFRRQHALNAAAVALGPIIATDNGEYSGRVLAALIVDLAGRLMPFLRGSSLAEINQDAATGEILDPPDPNTTSAPNTPPAPSRRATPLARVASGQSTEDGESRRPPDSKATVLQGESTVELRHRGQLTQRAWDRWKMPGQRVLKELNLDALEEMDLDKLDEYWQILMAVMEPVDDHAN